MTMNMFQFVSCANTSVLSLFLPLCFAFVILFHFTKCMKRNFIAPFRLNGGCMRVCVSEHASVCVRACYLYVCLQSACVCMYVRVCASCHCQCVRAKDRQRRLKRTRLTVGADCDGNCDSDGNCDRATAATATQTAKATAVLCVRRVKIRFACAVPRKIANCKREL